MSTVETELSQRLAALREGFDNAFAMPPAANSADLTGLLAIRIGGDAYALHVQALAHVQGACKIVTLPGARPEMLGLAGIRGRLVPVYSLAALLGYDKEATWNWVAMCQGEHAIGLAFDELEGYVQASSQELFPAPEVERSKGHVTEVLRKEGMTKMVVSISSIETALRGVVRGRTDL